MCVCERERERVWVIMSIGGCVAAHMSVCGRSASVCARVSVCGGWVRAVCAVVRV